MKRNRKHYIKWTPELDAQISELFPTMPSIKVAEIMGLTIGQVNCHAHQLGLHKNPDYLSKSRLQSITQLRQQGLSHSYPKGNIPMNKGVKMSAELRAKCQSSFFKKGNKPHNTKWDGYERVNAEGYTEVRIGEKQFIGKHRLIWEQHHGPVPAGMCIIFADGDKTNFKPSNLVCVSRGDLAILNKNKKYGKEIAESVLLLCKIKNRLKTIK